MVVPLHKKSPMLRDYSKRKSLSIKYSNRMRTSISSVSPKVRDSQESSRDSELSICKRKPIEDGDEQDVSEDGIQPTLDIQLPELVNWDITTELKSIRKYSELEKLTHSRQLVPQQQISLRRASTHQEVSYIMVRSEMIS